MYAKHYENPTMLSQVAAKNVGDVFWDTLYIQITGNGTQAKYNQCGVRKKKRNKEDE